MPKVTAKSGTRCPKEGKPREYIEAVPVEVPDTTYYRRLLADGSLVPAPAEAPAAPAKAKGAKTDEQ